MSAAARKFPEERAYLRVERRKVEDDERLDVKPNPKSSDCIPWSRRRL